MEIIMPYTSGETPEVGDYVKNQWEQPGTVTAVQTAKAGHEQVSIRWDDGGADLPSASASEFTLLSRSVLVTKGIDTTVIFKGKSQPDEGALQDEESINRADRAIQYGVVPQMTAKTMSGLQLLTEIMNGTQPAPPIQQALDFRLVQVEKGYAAFAGTPKFEYYNPLGSVHGGYTAALLDSCMACAVHSTLDAGSSYTTLEIKINYVRAITSDTGEVRAEGRVINSGKRIATAEGRLFDSAGVLYAHGTTTCLVLTF
jgi:uncharacterized protein (TIGR00369 family)